MNALSIFDKNASTYLQHNVWGSTDAVESVYYLLNNQVKVKTYLDLGSGPGTSALPFLALGVEEIIAVDGSLEMLTLFKETITKENKGSAVIFETIQCDLLNQPLEVNRIVDCVGVFGLCNYLTTESMEKVISKACQCISKNGYFCISIRLHNEVASKSSKEQWSGIWEGVDIYHHCVQKDISSQKIPKNRKKGADIFIHSEKEFFKLMEENHLSLCCMNYRKGIFILQKTI